MAIRVRRSSVRPLVVWTAVVLLLAVSAAGLAVRESAELVAGLREEMVLSVEEMADQLVAGDMAAVERAAMRFWRLAELTGKSYLARNERSALTALATRVSQLATGWRVSPLAVAQRQQIRLQLLNLRQVVLTGDYTQADSVLVWLER